MSCVFASLIYIFENATHMYWVFTMCPVFGKLLAMQIQYSSSPTCLLEEEINMKRDDYNKVKY